MLFFFVRINFVHVSTCILINYWLFFLNQSWMKNNMFCHGRIEHFPEVASVKIVWLLYIQMHRWLQFILFDQQNTCICLSDRFNDNADQLFSSNCSFMCDEVTLLTAECGGDKAFSVFFTGLNNDTLRWI